MKIDKFQLTLFLVWIVFTIVAFAFLTFERISEFDPNRVLENISNGEFVDKAIEDNNAIYKANTIVNFYQADCACNNVSETHINQLELIARKSGFEFINVEVNEELYIPSTPSIAILGSASELIYFGPYGEGLGCTQTNGFATTVLENHLKGYSANLIVSSAKGCYCNTGIES